MGSVIIQPKTDKKTLKKEFYNLKFAFRFQSSRFVTKNRDKSDPQFQKSSKELGSFSDTVD